MTRAGSLAYKKLGYSDVFCLSAILLAIYSRKPPTWHIMELYALIGS